MAQLRAGAMAVQITPPLGVSLAGSYDDHRAEDVLSDLFARALVLDDGAARATILTLDICYIDPPVAGRIAARVEAMTGIPAERVMLTCTHTHAGPVTDVQPWFAPDQPYLDVLARRAADAVTLAHRRMRPARLLAGSGHEDSLAFNRRYWMRDGSVRTNPGLQNPEIVRPAGPIDPEVGVVRVEDADGRPIAVLVNYALHVAVVGGAISSDYPGALARAIGRLEGPEVVVLFSTGCCGDINQLDVGKPGPQSGQDRAEQIGAVLAGEVLKASTRLAPVADAPSLAFARRTVELPLRVPTPDDLARAQERYPFIMHSMDTTGLEAVAAHRMWWIGQQGRASDPAEVQVLAVGELAYVTLPAEIFVELGLAIKAGSPFPQTLIGMLNGSIFAYYIPTEKAYGEGGYEVANSAVAPGSGELLVEAALDALREAHGQLHRGAGR